MKKLLALAIVPLFLCGCEQWWTASSDSPAPSESPPTVILQGPNGPVVVAPVPEPTAIAESWTQPTAEPTIAPSPTSAASTGVPVSVAAAPLPVASAGTTSCLGLRQVMVTSFGRLVCTLNELYASTSPFNTPLSEEQYTVLPAAVEQKAFNLEAPWGPPRATEIGNMPMYASSSANDVLVTVVCTAYGTRCNASGQKVYVNPSDQVQYGTDQHLDVIDPRNGVEVDCWQALDQSGSQSSGKGNLTVNLAGGHLTCSWAGAYPLGGSGLYQPGAGSGIALGDALGVGMLTPEEMLAGHVNHALLLATNCANNPNLFPSDPRRTTDTPCDGTGSPPHYGDVFQLNWSQAKIAASNHSAPCKAVLTALATYGGVVSDTGNAATELDAQLGQSFTADPTEMGANPWPGLLALLQAGGDSDGANFGFCLTGLQAGDFNLLELAQPARAL